MGFKGNNSPMVLNIETYVLITSWAFENSKIPIQFDAGFILLNYSMFCMTISYRYFRGELLLTAENTSCARQVTRDIRWHNENIIAIVTHSGQLQMVDARTGLVVRIADFWICRAVMLVCQFFFISIWKQCLSSIFCNFAISVYTYCSYYFITFFRPINKQIFGRIPRNVIEQFLCLC